MIEVLQAARKVQRFLEQQDWDFAFIGGLAVNRWGRARTTNDADICLFTDFGRELTYVDALLEEFQSRMPDAKEFALQHRVLLLQTESGFGIDISLGGLDFERDAVQRSSLFEFPDSTTLRTVSADDLLIYKAFAGRDQDWIDIKGVIIRQQDNLDWDAILTGLTPLCELKQAPETIDQLLALRDELQRED